MPQLRKNSAARISKNPEYQVFLRCLEKVKLRQNELPANTIDDQIKIGMEDLQMDEAVNVLKDMLFIEVESRLSEKVSTN